MLELKGVEARRDELAVELREVLEEHSRIYAAYTEAVRAYSGDEANNLATSLPDMYARWLRQRFVKWF